MRYNCDKCGLKIKNYLRNKRYLFLCRSCYNGEVTIILPNRDHSIPLEKALEKVYFVRTYMRKDGQPDCTISVPSAFLGKKVKLVIVEDEVVTPSK